MWAAKSRMVALVWPSVEIFALTSCRSFKSAITASREAASRTFSSAVRVQRQAINDAKRFVDVIQQLLLAVDDLVEADEKRSAAVSLLFLADCRVMSPSIFTKLWRIGPMASTFWSEVPLPFGTASSLVGEPRPRW